MTDEQVSAFNRKLRKIGDAIESGEITEQDPFPPTAAGKRGRPPSDPADRLPVRQVYLSNEDWQRVKFHAQQQRISASAYMRALIRKADQDAR